MRILSQDIDLDAPDHRIVRAAVPDDAVPEVGDRIEIDGQPFIIEAVYKWYEAYSSALAYKERAVDMRIRRDDDPEASVTETHPPHQPPTLSAGAEADPPINAGTDDL